MNQKGRSEPDAQLAMEGFERKTNSGRIRALSRGMKRHMTPQERKLYSFLFRQMNIPVVRQKVIDNYIVDFLVQPDIVIELDGSQHFSEEGSEKDRKRDEHLRSLGYTVLRYANSDITSNFEAVCEDILSHI